MNPLFQAARRLQWLGDAIPERWRLPLRYRVQSLVGGLEPEIAVLPALVPRHAIALDIGANMGIYTYVLASLAERVHAFEPQSACCAVISGWADGRDVHVHNVGVGARAGELTLHIPVIAGRKVGTRASFVSTDDQHVNETVPVLAIDDLGLDSVGFVKIDVEGFEYDVLLGASETLRRCKPALLVEMDRQRQSRETFERTLSFLSALGYSPWVVESNVLTRCEGDVWEAAREHYNFIFRQ
jgi:FkbM family methyltransferase